MDIESVKINLFRFSLGIASRNPENKRDPFQVKSNWIPPVQPSVALESYLEEVKVQLAGIRLTKPKDNLPNTERKSGVENATRGSQH